MFCDSVPRLATALESRYSSRNTAVFGRKRGSVGGASSPTGGHWLPSFKTLDITRSRIGLYDTCGRTAARQNSKDSAVVLLSKGICTMPRRHSALPKLCHHKRSNRAVVYIDRIAIYLGPHGSAEAGESTSTPDAVARSHFHVQKWVGPACHIRSCRCVLVMFLPLVGS